MGISQGLKDLKILRSRRRVTSSALHLAVSQDNVGFQIQVAQAYDYRDFGTDLDTFLRVSVIEYTSKLKDSHNIFLASCLLDIVKAQLFIRLRTACFLVIGDYTYS